jgi:hypothetical protein
MGGFERPLQRQLPEESRAEVRCTYRSKYPIPKGQWVFVPCPYAPTLTTQNLQIEYAQATFVILLLRLTARPQVLSTW